MARATPEDVAGELELERDRPDRRAARDLGARIAELPSAHPSAAGYASDQPAAPRRLPRDSPSVAEAGDYASASDIRLTADRRAHIVDGDQTGGGHRHGTGQPDKTEFPAEWDDNRIIDAIVTVARKPDQAPERQNWNQRWLVSGKHDGVEIVAIVESDGHVWTAWPREGSPGVVKNGHEDS